MSDEDAASALCRTCGLCCDGTIFDYVPITADESVRLLHRLPVIGDRNGRGLHIEQRCVALGVRGCDVYVDRPRSCARFRCKLLRRVEAGETPLADALATIETILAPVMRLDDLLPRGKSIRARRHLLAEHGDDIAERSGPIWDDVELLTDLVRRELIDDEEEDPPPTAGPRLS